MEKITTNATEKFADKVNNLDVNIRKVTTPNNVSVYAEIMQGGSQVGSLSYDKSANYLNLNIKPFSEVSKENVEAIYAKTPEWINELIR